MNPTLLLSLLFIAVATCKSISHSSYPHSGHNHQYRNHEKRHDTHSGNGGNHHNEHTDHHGSSHEHSGNNHQHFAGEKHGGGGEKHNFEPYHDPLLIETKSGKVRGYAKEVLGREVHIFTGIPFAKPPIGNLRFKKPVPIGRWPGNFIDATHYPTLAIRRSTNISPDLKERKCENPNTNLSEDCLYLNIWAPPRLSS
ncbi:hypothetical protein WDU94_007237 [Cyamophila willieti]